MDLGLRDAHVLVTAASSGLGAATARRFSLEGARVVINSRDESRLQATAKAIEAASGNPVMTYAADVTDPEAVQRLIAYTVDTLGGLDVLVTNAGGPPSGVFDDFTPGDWEAAARLTLVSTVSLIQAALPHLRQSKQAAILTINSIAARQPVANLTLSNTLRPAVAGLTKTLSLELAGDGIRVNGILPGITGTERVRYLMESRAAKNGTTVEMEYAAAAQSIPLGRIGTPDEFANAAVFLCSPAAGFMTGVSLPVDGGGTVATL
ncbi:MAG: SDR family oxidoreductase [Anaerolineaceae bacterium]|nr:SDR family oxidoreductase [Anaerolineaceae bacterium]